MRGALLLKLLSDDAEAHAHAELASILLPPQASLSQLDLEISGIELRKTTRGFYGFQCNLGILTWDD
nr:hypothetical protein CFP56_72110 [Quercus suber]